MIQKTFRRWLAAGVGAGLVLSTLAATPAAVAAAKPKPCKKGYVRNKAKRCVRKATTVKKTTAKPTTATTAKPTVAKGTIKLGVIYNTVNASTGAATLKETLKIASAWQDSVNTAGGINGYKIQLLLRDARGDTARVVQAVKEIDKAGALAIAGQEASQQMPATDKYLNDHGLPLIGGDTSAPEFDYDPMYFPVSGGFYPSTYGNVAAVRDSGAKSAMQMYCTESPGCAAAVNVWRDATAREGIRWQAQSASAVASDYTSVCLRAKDFGAEFVQNAGLNQANLVRDCSRQNFHPIYGVGGQTNQATIDATAGDRLAGALPEFGIFYDGPEVQGFRKLLAQTDLDLKSTSAAPGVFSVRAWLALEMARTVINKLNQPNPTRQDFLDALYTVKGETLGGQIAPVDYTVQRPGTGRHAGNDCWTEYIVKDAKYFHMDKSGQIVNRLTFVCGSGFTFTSRPPS